MKICNKCKLDLNESQFFKDNKAKDKLQSWCKICRSKNLSSYYKRNPKKRCRITKEQARKRYHKNKVSWNISRRIRQSLNGISKKVHWENITNYTLVELKSHLENLFTSQMNWDNYGSYWHIDHIIPISYFNITSLDCEDFKKCWALNNLQPLEAKENIRKSNKIAL